MVLPHCQTVFYFPMQCTASEIFSLKHPDGFITDRSQLATTTLLNLEQIQDGRQGCKRALDV